MTQIKDELAKIVQDVVKHIVINADEDYDRSFKELGIDSLDLLSILFAVQEKFGIDIQDEYIDQLTTLNATIDYIKCERNPD